VLQITSQKIASKTVLPQLIRTVRRAQRWI